MAVFRSPLDNASSSLSTPASPVVGDVFVEGTDGVFGPVGVLGFLDLHFSEAHVECRGGFCASSELVVVMGNDRDSSSDSRESLSYVVDLSRGWGVGLPDDALNSNGEWHNAALL